MSQETNLSEENSLSSCQSCGKNDPNLINVDSGLKLALAQSGMADAPSLVCSSCLKTFKKSASQGAQLKAQEEAENKNRASAWRGRLTLVKQGRAFLQREQFGEAIVAYEKYVKLLSIVIQKEKRNLDPKDFNDNPKEITIISSVLWDLMLLYDSHPKFAPKQKEAGEILSRFLRFSPIYNTVIRKAEKEVRRSKNPAAYKDFLKLCDVQATRCFIANAAFETRTDPNVIILCNFRDKVLKSNRLGRSFVCWYYKHSPVVAARIETMPSLQKPIQTVLRGVARLIKLIFSLPDSRDS